MRISDWSSDVCSSDLPLQVAEQFGTLASLYPDRIDLGLGRAPGTDQATVRALRRYFDGADAFPQDVAELLRYFEPVGPGQPVQAVPGGGIQVPVWLLGSSLFSAQLAAAMGLPYAFASHFAPGAIEQALGLYRQGFRPSTRLAKPDRKGAGEGKLVSIRVDLGVPRTIKTTNIARQS